jgi:hypothetical protein
LGGLQLGGDGEEFVSDPHPLIVTSLVMLISNWLGVLWHHLIRSSSQGGGGKRASTDYFALKLNASS